MKFFPAIENYILSNTRHMNIRVEMDSIDHIGHVVSTLKEQGIRIYDIETDRELSERFTQVDAVISLLLPEKRRHIEIITMLSQIDGVIAIDEI